MDDRPVDIPGYLIWIRRQLGNAGAISPKTQITYEAAAAKVRMDFEASALWRGLASDLSAIDQRYYANTHGHHLFTRVEMPPLLVKSYDSVLLKSYRKNVLDNANWPDEPDGGWYVPDNWLEKLNDIVRTQFVVRYLDGVRFLTDVIDEHCRACALDFGYNLEAREQGYYAAHLYTTQPTNLIGKRGTVRAVRVPVEIQITTQVQEVIGQLTHREYERRRVRPASETSDWQWDYDSEQFTVNYLGHVLHYIEGVVMNLRDRGP